MFRGGRGGTGGGDAWFGFDSVVVVVVVAVVAVVAVVTVVTVVVGIVVEGVAEGVVVAIVGVVVVAETEVVRPSSEERNVSKFTGSGDNCRSIDGFAIAVRLLFGVKLLEGLLAAPLSTT